MLKVISYIIDMAIYHHCESVISRSTGRSVVQAAAYISGTNIQETRRGLTADFRHREDSVAMWEQLAPEHAPLLYSALKFWDTLENEEDQWAYSYFQRTDALERHLLSAQVGHTVVIALPRELDRIAHQAIARAIAQRAFVAQGHVVLYAIHVDEGNPHVHFLVSRRTVTATGELSRTKDRILSMKAALRVRRQLTAEVINHALEAAYIDQLVDHRSFADQGIAFTPTRHEGYAARSGYKKAKMPVFDVKMKQF
jgi:hypothetical protein